MILSVCPNPSVDVYAYIDGFRLGETNRIRREELYPGGKATHVALAVSELGIESALLGFWGGDTGAWLKEQCANRGVRCIGPSLSDPNRRCYTFRSSNETVDDTELLSPGPAVSRIEADAFFSDYEKALDGCDLVALSGSWPIPELVDSYGGLIEAARRKGKKAVLDASGEALRAGLEERPYALHLNWEEATDCSDLDALPAVLDYFADRVHIAVITRGAEGLFLACGEERLAASVNIGAIGSAVGSGDCVVAGIAKALIEEGRLEDVAREAVACGAANCLREDLGMLHASDVRDLYPEISVDALSRI